MNNLNGTTPEEVPSQNLEQNLPKSRRPNLGRRARTRKKRADSVEQCSQMKIWTKKSMPDMHHLHPYYKKRDKRARLKPSSKLLAASLRHSVATESSGLDTNGRIRQDNVIQNLDRLGTLRSEGLGSALAEEIGNSSVRDSECVVEKVNQFNSAGDECVSWLQNSGETKFSYSGMIDCEAKVETALVYNNSCNTKMDNRTENNSPIASDKELGVSDSQDYHEGTDCTDDTESSIKLGDRIPYSKGGAKFADVLGCAAKEQQETNNIGTYDHDVSIELDDNKTHSTELVACFGRANAYASKTVSSAFSADEACFSAVGICLSCQALPQCDNKSVIITWIATNTIDSEAAPCVIKRPHKPRKYVMVQQESQIGYESHLNGGVMVNGHVLVYYNISMMLVGSLRGDKANRPWPHDYSSFGSLRSKSRLEQFCDTNNETTFASFRENNRVNYAQSAYRAEIVGASNLAGVYSEPDVAQNKQVPCIIKDGPAQDQRQFAGTCWFYVVLCLLCIL